MQSPIAIADVVIVCSRKSRSRSAGPAVRGSAISLLARGSAREDGDEFSIGG
jgi:hypothetical protein